jgi:hypothetical protein
VKYICSGTLCRVRGLSEPYPSHTPPAPRLSMKKFIFIFVCCLAGCTPYAVADMITSNGREMKVIFSEKLTPEQLQLIKEIHKDQLDAEKDLTKLDAETTLQTQQAQTDKNLARDVVFYAFGLVLLLIIVLIIVSFRQRRNYPVDVGQEPIRLAYRVSDALPEYVDESSAIMRRDHSHETR